MDLRRRLVGSKVGKAGRPVDAWRWPRCRSEVASIARVVTVVDVARCTHARVMRIATVGYHAMRLA
jgi:hypothetical protein